MRVFREPEGPDFGKDALTFALGAAGGLALGMLLSRRVAPQRVGRLGTDLVERARSVGDRARTAARRLQPARLRRMAVEQAGLTALEDQVLDAFLGDELLSERGIDVGAISPGIVELSGSVWTVQEADRAVRLANSLPEVRTVVNRMDIEDEIRKGNQARRRLDDEEGTFQHNIGRTGGMGARRQGRETDPSTSDDSHHRELRALEEADLAQLGDEGIATSGSRPRNDQRPEVQSPWRTNYDEDELDNQDPHGKHADYTLDEQPQELNTGARVGEGLKTGMHLRMEDADVDVKPHGGMKTEGEK